MLKIKSNANSINQSVEASKGRKKENKLPGGRADYTVKIYDPIKKEFYNASFI